MVLILDLHQRFTHVNTQTEIAIVKRRIALILLHLRRDADAIQSKFFLQY
jgi:hypothetical protein